VIAAREIVMMASNLIEVPDDIEGHSAQEFEFEVVTVNGLGEITERQTHTAKQFIENLDGGVSLGMVVIPRGDGADFSLSLQGSKTACG
jgi:hypothetical protein